MLFSSQFCLYKGNGVEKRYTNGTEEDGVVLVSNDTALLRAGGIFQRHLFKQSRYSKAIYAINKNQRPKKPNSYVNNVANHIIR